MSTKQELVILPGWSGNHILWQHQLLNLNDIVNPKIIIIINQDTIEKMAAEVLTQTADEFILVGHSLGGLVAQQIAIKHPQRVSKLILMATWTGAASVELKALFKKMLQRIKNNRKDLLLDEIRPNLIYKHHINRETLLQQIQLGQAQFPTQGLINQTLAEITATDTSTFLQQIYCPTLIIHGRQDAFFSLQVQQDIKNKIPNAKLTIIEECGHMLSIERPEAITALLRLWIQI